MPKIRSDLKNVILYGLTALILAAGLALLIYLERRIVGDRRAAIDNARNLIGRERVLKATDDIRISFSTIEALASSVVRSPFINRIYISKLTPVGDEQVIHPFYYAAKTGDQLPPGELVREPLVDNGKTLGYLYLDMNNRIIIGVRAAAGSFAVLLILTFISFYLRVSAQQKVISATTVELEEKRREMIRLERLALAGQLSANIIHDIKKPVLNIKQETQDLKDLSQSESRNIAERIREQVDLFFNILRDLGLERFVKAHDGGNEFVDLNEILDRSLRLVRYEKGAVEVRKEYSGKIPLVLAQPYKLIQLFSNLILNAYQAMQGNGTLTLSTKERDGFAVITISDNGPGIPQENIPKLFTPFFTTRSKAKPREEEGTGLGLYISKNIIEEMHGAIKVESEPGKGAAFIIRLPAAPGEE